MHRRDLLKKSIPIALAVGSLPAVGCAELQHILLAAAQEYLKKPNVKILNMTIKKMSLTHIDTLFDVEIFNPNSIPLHLAGLTWDLDLGKKSFISGKSKKGISLAANKKSRNQFDIRLPLQKAAGTMLELLKKKEISYDLSSIFTLGSKTINFDVPVKFSGMLPLPQLPQIALKNIGFTKISMAGLSGKVVLSVLNPNAFSLPLDRVMANLQLNGHQVLKDSGIRSLKLPSKRKKDVQLDFTLGLAEIGLSAVSLLRKPQIKWNFSSELISSGLKFPFKKSGKMPLRLS